MSINQDVLDRAAASGDHLSKPRNIEFEHLFPGKSAAARFQLWAEGFGYRCELSKYEPDVGKFESEWNVTCVKFMVPTLENIAEIERRLDELARQKGGYADG